MESILSSPSFEDWISPAIKIWLTKDAMKPVEWLEANKANLSTSQREHAVQGIAEYTAREGDSETAWKWVDQITDPKLRKTAEGHVWSMERDAVRQAAGQSPDTTLQAMVAGNSQHADYWLEEAMATWMAKDPAAARDWYQKNSDTIPAGKSQYLAAAFANEALRQGDTGTARQWTARIQDAKTRQRITESIAKAEGQEGQ